MKLARFLEDELSLGKGSIKMPAKEYIDKQRTAYEKVKSKISSKVIKITGDDSIYILAKIPSGSLENFNYDVLLQFGAPGGTFEESDIKIFSNSPSFVYSFAYVFYHLDDDENQSKGLIVDEYHKKIPKNRLLIAEDKLDEQILHQCPHVRNPYGIPLFDKSVYLAIFHVLEKYKKGKLFGTKIMQRASLYKEVQDFEMLMLLRQKLELKAKEEALLKRVEDGSNKVKKYVKDSIRDGSIVHVSKSNVITVQPSTNVRRVTAASTSVNKIKSGKGSAVKSRKS